MTIEQPADEDKDDDQESDDLLDDLESIKDLLNEEDLANDAAPADTEPPMLGGEAIEAAIPVLDNIEGSLAPREEPPIVVEDALESATESAAAIDAISTGISTGIPAGISDETFDSLLSDTWQDSVEEMFEQARGEIEANSQRWLPEHTDDLTDALKIRIDHAVKSWLAETLHANIGALRTRFVAELSDEISMHLSNLNSESAKDT